MARPTSHQADRAEGPRRLTRPRTGISVSAPASCDCSGRLFMLCLTVGRRGRGKVGTLPEKLGFRPGRTGWLFDAPEELATAIGWPDTPPMGMCDLILGFVRNRAEIAPALARALAHYQRGNALWFSYPKKSGSIRSDLSRDDGWQPLTDAGLIPVTQIALDENWSALRFRYRDEVKKITRRTHSIAD